MGNDLHAYNNATTITNNIRVTRQTSLVYHRWKSFFCSWFSNNYFTLCGYFAVNF